MIVFDTDHASVLQRSGSDRHGRLVDRMRANRAERFAVSIVSVEEQVRGWLASIAKERLAVRQVPGYRELRGLFDFFARFEILPFSEEAAGHFDRLRPQVRRVGAMDLKIACTALSADALFLTANRRDFERVPGLRFENWLD